MAAKEARSAAIEGYRKKLETQKSAAETKLDAANTGCADARTVWLAMQEPLAATNTELKLVPLSDVSPPRSPPPTPPTARGLRSSRRYDAKVAAAIKAASANSVVIKTATADKEKIDAELKRLDEQAEKEERMANKFDDYEGIGGASSAPSPASTSAMAPPGVPARPHRSRPVYLPDRVRHLLPERGEDHQLTPTPTRVGPRFRRPRFTPSAGACFYAKPQNKKLTTIRRPSNSCQTHRLPNE